MTDMSCALLVIGAGPGGYVCAIRAAQLGIDTIIVESAATGGTCLNVGCIPSKALIHAADEFYKLQSYANAVGTSSSALGITASDAKIKLTQTQAWKNSIVKRLNTGVGHLLNKAGVKTVLGVARFRDGKSVTVKTAADDTTIRAENLVIAAGSEAVELDSLPFGGNIISSTEALSLEAIPKSMAVVGGGYIGLEIGTAYAKLGTRVSIIETAADILPQYDSSLTRPVRSSLKKIGLELLCGTSATDYDPDKKQLILKTDSGESKSLDADKVLVTVGRRARMQGWGLTELSLTTQDGFLEIDNRCQTSMRGVYAVGDITGEPMLAHRAMAQGELVAEVIAGLPREWDKACIPAICYTDPEVVSVGQTAKEAEESGTAVGTAEFPFQANGRAMSIESDDGFIRVIYRQDNHALVGIQGVGKGISELSAAFALAIEMGARCEDIAATIHAHPTMSEGFHEACLKSLGHAIHI